MSVAGKAVVAVVRFERGKKNEPHLKFGRYLLIVP